MKRFLEPIVIISLTLILISLTYIPIITKNISAPPNTVYTAVHNYVLDYYIYLSFIKEGQNGSLLAYELHTSEPHLGSLSHILYLASGWVTGPLNISPFVVYHIIRLIGALFLALSIYKFISLFTINKSKISPPLQRIMLFFLSYASGGFLDYKNMTPLLNHLTQIDVVRRSAFLPHWTFQNALFLFALGYLINNSIAKAGLIIFVLNLFSPFHSTMLIICFSLLTGVRTVKNLINHEDIFFDIKNLISLVIFFLPSFIYINFAYSLGPLANIKSWEAVQQEDVTFYFINLLKHIGPTVFLAPLGLALALKKLNAKNFLIISITILTFFFLLDLRLDIKLGISNFRFYNLPVFVFLGIFSFYTINAVVNMIKSKILQQTVFITIFSVLILISTVFYKGVFNQISKDGSDLPFNYYIPKDLYRAMSVLNKNSDLKKDIVLSRFITGNMIPGISGNRVYLGHTVSTINFYAKRTLTEKFFNNQMTPTEAKKFLQDNKISIVFQGPEEVSFKPSAYPFLKQFYKNSSVTIFENPLP